MKTVNVHDAKTNLSRLLAQVEEGEEIVIAKAGIPVAKLISIARVKPPRRVLGKDKGKIWISDDFDETLTEEIPNKNG
jgi:prevent-host-death family protein